jgi:hypothetical protein
VRVDLEEWVVDSNTSTENGAKRGQLGHTACQDAAQATCKATNNSSASALQRRDDANACSQLPLCPCSPRYRRRSSCSTTRCVGRKRVVFRCVVIFVDDEKTTPPCHPCASTPPTQPANNALAPLESHPLLANMTQYLLGHGVGRWIMRLHTVCKPFFCSCVPGLRGWERRARRQAASDTLLCGVVWQASTTGRLHLRHASHAHTKMRFGCVLL